MVKIFYYFNTVLKVLKGRLYCLVAVTGLVYLFNSLIMYLVSYFIELNYFFINRYLIKYCCDLLGTVTLWAPNMKDPLVKMLCHRGPVQAIAIDNKGQ